MARDVDVLEVGGDPPPRRWRRWQVALLILVAALLAALAVHGAVSHPHQAGRGKPRVTPTYQPPPALAALASRALPTYPGTVPPIGYLDAGRSFLGDYGAAPGQRIQVDAACAGTGQVLLSAAADAGQSPAAGQVLGGATVLCSNAPGPVTVTFTAPPEGRYQVVFTPGPATGVLAWRLVPWGS